MKGFLPLIRVASVCLALASMSAWAADKFVAGFEDLPLMPGLSQMTGTSVLFDTPQGRIVQASAVGDVSRLELLQFYVETLPQLGWTRVGEEEFRREGEQLRFEFKVVPNGLEVRFLVEPAAGR